MSNQNKSEKKKENPFLKGWNDFVSGIKDGFENFQKTLESQTQNNVEDMDRSKNKVDNFFNRNPNHIISIVSNLLILYLLLKIRI